MGAIEFITTNTTYQIEAKAGETILEMLRRSNIPLQSSLILSEDLKPVSVTQILGPDERIKAFSLRNPDFKALLPQYDVVARDHMATEIIRPLTSPGELVIRQYTREEAIEHVYQAFATVIKHFVKTAKLPHKPLLQVSLSAGGDSRILAECIQRYKRENEDCDFYCVTIANGFEDESDLLVNSAAIARQYELKHAIFDLKSAAQQLGYKKDLGEIIKDYSETHDKDELEVLGTYWIQEINKLVSADIKSDAFVFGYNQEDVIAEKLYGLILNRHMPSYPVRHMEGMTILAPLCQVPKKMLDSLDIPNSMRNYNIRVPSVSYLRSCLYFMAYHICEQYPAIADVLSASPLSPDDPDHILEWLDQYK